MPRNQGYSGILANAVKVTIIAKTPKTKKTKMSDMTINFKI